MINNLVRGAHGLMGVIRVVSGALLVGSVAVNFANIIGRYFLSVSIPWAEEVMLFMMIGCVFLNCGLVGWSSRQIRMDAFVSMLPPALRSIVELVCELVLMATSLLLAILAWPVVSMIKTPRASFLTTGNEPPAACNNAESSASTNRLCLLGSRTCPRGGPM